MSWIESLGGQLISGITWLVQQGCELGSVGIGKLIQSAGFSPSEIDKFHQFSQYFCSLIIDGVNILDHLFKGAGQGVQGFVKNAQTYLQAAIEKLVGKDAVLLFETLTAKKN